MFQGCVWSRRFLESEVCDQGVLLQMSPDQGLCAPWTMVCAALRRAGGCPRQQQVSGGAIVCVDREASKWRRTSIQLRCKVGEKEAN